MSTRLNLSLLAVIGLMLAACSNNNPSPQSSSARAKALPAILAIGHRGAPAYWPEHTLASYDLAIEYGADVIEPDLVATRDGQLVARHENEISGTTDVADHPEFTSRRSTKLIDGVSLTGWFTEDFTLAELKTLRAKERIPAIRPDNTRYNGLYTIPTLQEVIDLAKARTTETGRTIAIYPETKHPTYFQSIGLPLEQRLLDVLSANGYTTADAPVFIQSFEVANLKALRTKTSLRLIQLLSAPPAQPYDFVAAGDPRGYADLITPAGLAELARTVNGIGPDKNMVIARTGDGHLGAESTLVTDAHAAGLLVHPYTFRPENNFLPADYRSSSDITARGDAYSEILRFLQAGVDGVFSDDSFVSRAAIDGFVANR
ncbi:glycerophosphoryl diester phosphodiesterase [Solimonas aquatica]|uniref:glycerophosphodiester phosphodiesterase n=1 Tax=Solimonas aquatica TaxID=489703 RepID=A0A1H9F673_9GAMM|nr:glycerophosphodiester phosphodiesterase [Solimonas aquatica]SEQ33484.1 glycerophosphoryl diester phosphodiesterase [Solimonas aquatica]